MRRHLLVFFLLLAVIAPVSAVVLNSVAAKIGDYTITTYDLQRMEAFIKASTGAQATNTSRQAFEDLLFIYGLKSIQAQATNGQIKIKEKDWGTYVNQLTNEKASQQSIEFYRDYSHELRLAFEKMQLIQAIARFDATLGEKLSAQPTEQEIKDFYQKNKKQMVDYPQLDLIYMLVPMPNNLSLDELTQFEKNLQAIGAALKKNDNLDEILAKYPGIKPEFFSGKTGLKPYFELIQQNIPQFIINIGLQPKPIQTSKGMLTVRSGTVVGPEPIKLPENSKSYYFIMKVVTRVDARQLTLEESRAKISRVLQEQQFETIFNTYLSEKMRQGEIPVSIISKEYQGVYDEFIRR